MEFTWAKGKTEGDWLIRGPSGYSIGEDIEITKKDGSTQPATLGKCIWTGQDNRTGDDVSLYLQFEDTKDDRQRKPQGGGGKQNSSRTPRCSCTCPACKDCAHK